MEKQTKTHWLQSPNKNYLGHWDLPESGEIILTIKSAQWEVVKNPITNTSESKRVVRFEENVKPMICNQTNANSILKSTGIKYMEDAGGNLIKLYVANIVDKRTKEDIDCIRVKNSKVAKTKPELNPKSSNWDNAKERAKEGISIEDVRKHYNITQENFDLLCG